MVSGSANWGGSHTYSCSDPNRLTGWWTFSLLLGLISHRENVARTKNLSTESYGRAVTRLLVTTNHVVFAGVCISS